LFAALFEAPENIAAAERKCASRQCDEARDAHLHFIHQFKVKSNASESGLSPHRIVLCRVRVCGEIEMTALIERCRYGRFPGLVISLLAMITFASGPALADGGGGGDSEIDVVLDQARLVKLPERVSTLVIGNPLIADASVQPGGLMVVTGKGYGVTNVIALDRSGATLMEKQVVVKGPLANTVVVYRGIARETYSCAPFCEPRVTLGDSSAFFGNNLSQTGTWLGQVNGAAQLGVK
jgi:hypothetical protein